MDLGRNVACWICFNDIEKNILLSNVEAEKLLNNCMSHLDTSIRIKSLGSEMLLTICNCCFNSTLQLVQLDEQLVKLRKEIELAGSLFSRGVVERRNQFTAAFFKPPPPGVNNPTLSTNQVTNSSNHSSPVVSPPPNLQQNIAELNNIQQSNGLPYYYGSKQSPNAHQTQNQNFPHPHNSVFPHSALTAMLEPSVYNNLPLAMNSGSNNIEQCTYNTHNHNEIDNNFDNYNLVTVKSEIDPEDTLSCDQFLSGNSPQTLNAASNSNDDSVEVLENENSQGNYGTQFVDVKVKHEFPTEDIELLDEPMKKERFFFDEVFDSEDKCVNVPLEDVTQTEEDPLGGIGEDTQVQTTKKPNSRRTSIKSNTSDDNSHQSTSNPSNDLSKSGNVPNVPRDREKFDTGPHKRVKLDSEEKS